MGYAGTSSGSRISTVIIGYAVETIACCSMLKVTTFSSIVCCTAKRLMIKTSFEKFAVEIARKRREMTRLQEELGDMLDHLAVIEARAKSANGKRYSTAEVKRALRI